MINALKTFRQQPPSILSSSSSSLSSSFGHRASVIRFSHSTEPGNTEKMDKDNNPKTTEKMDKADNPNEKTGDVMSHSFGEGYATRSDEEGFGGIYGGNQTLQKDETAEEIHENHPDYDKTQGSEVKEKEKGRNQIHGSS